ncbi:uncharacterized protein LOC116567886 [Mustela erminea]|uniref:uncharacterized protein LOC116567886 n=1 Tax=Mustela erminea TaxID=36723 RepID=UPI0013871DF7|nr:uncharacterized protein LOC116567886 [Mustela erminea]
MGTSTGVPELRTSSPNSQRGACESREGGGDAGLAPALLPPPHLARVEAQKHLSWQGSALDLAIISPDPRALERIPRYHHSPTQEKDELPLAQGADQGLVPAWGLGAWRGRAGARSLGAVCAAEGLCVSGASLRPSFWLPGIACVYECVPVSQWLVSVCVCPPMCSGERSRVVGRTAESGCAGWESGFCHLRPCALDEFPSFFLPRCPCSWWMHSSTKYLSSICSMLGTSPGLGGRSSEQKSQILALVSQANNKERIEYTICHTVVSVVCVYMGSFRLRGLPRKVTLG